MEDLSELIAATYPPLDPQERAEWTAAGAPAASLRALGDAVHALDALDSDAKVQVACAVARYLGSRYAGALGWDDASCRSIAESILLLPSIGFTRKLSASTLIAPPELVPRMLAQLRPLLPAPAGVSSTSGRATKQPSNTRNLEHQDPPSVCSGDTMRNPALGAGGLLYVSLASLLDLTTTDAQAWEVNAPALIPALLALLSMPSPSSRLEALHVLCLLLCNVRARAHLHRTGLVPLITQHLDASASFISAPLGGALLLASTKARVLLPCEGEEEAWEQACAAADAVLRAWAYAPASSAVGLDMPPDSPAGDEPSDVLTASFEALQLLCKPLGLAGTARYLGTSLEFLAAHIAEARMTRAKAAAEAVVALVRVLDVVGETKPPPGLEAWSGRVLSSAAKAWTLVKEENKGSTQEREELLASLVELCEAFVKAQPDVSKAHLKRIQALDPELFEPLVGPALADSS